MFGLASIENNTIVFIRHLVCYSDKPVALINETESQGGYIMIGIINDICADINNKIKCVWNMNVLEKRYYSKPMLKYLYELPWALDN